MPAPGYKKWNGVYRRIMLLHAKGMDNNHIAKVVEMHPCTISDIINSDHFKVRLAEFEEKATEKARELFEKNAVAAAQRIIKIAKDGKPDERLQFDASKEVLYQVGVKPIEVIETRKREYTTEEIESALKTSKEVEEIANRLGVDKSRFLFDNGSSSPAPVTEETVSDPVPETTKE